MESVSATRPAPEALALNSLYAVTVEPNNYLVVWVSYADIAILNNLRLLESPANREKLSFNPILHFGNDKGAAIEFANEVARQFGARVEICVE